MAMSPPRRPKGEKPATTIRFLRRQIANMEQEIITTRDAIEDRDKVIAGYDVDISVAQDTINMLRDQTLTHQADRQRLAFLEGYYAKSQETAPTPRWTVPASFSHLPGDQSDSYARERPRDQENLSAGRQDPEGRAQKAAAGFGERPGETIRREPAYDQTRPRRDAVEHVEIIERNGPREYDATGIHWMAI